jgi:hypothetical protein
MLIRQVRKSLIVVFTMTRVLQDCLIAMGIGDSSKYTLNVSLDELTWIVNDKDEPYVVYSGSDQRTIRLLASVGHVIVTYEVSEEVASIVEKQYWLMQEQIHRINLNESIQLYYCNAKIK